MFGLSFWEIGVSLIVALVVLGPKRLPALARSLGAGLRTLRRASSDLRSAAGGHLKEIQEPLEGLRDDLYETVHFFEREVQAGMSAGDATNGPETARLGNGPTTEGSVSDRAPSNCSTSSNPK